MTLLIKYTHEIFSLVTDNQQQDTVQSVENIKMEKISAADAPIDKPQKPTLLGGE